jgi:putative pyruvate formate lyase activating enzyme
VGQAYYTDSNSKLRFAACLRYGKTSSLFTSYRATLNWKPYYPSFVNKKWGTNTLHSSVKASNKTTAKDADLNGQSHYRRCCLCERRCGVDRLNGNKGGCGADVQARVFRHRVEYGEELELVPSHLFYLSGCNLRCCFCIGGEISVHPEYGQPLTDSFFVEALDWGRKQGARNLQWVGGEPTIHLPSILEIMAGVEDLPPVVWKSNFFTTPEAFALLSDVVDVYVADFKFGNDACANRLAGVAGYWETVTRNLTIAADQGDLIVRHLLLPGHFDCCFRPILAWMQQHLPKAKFNLREGYLPAWQASRCEELTLPVDAATARQARILVREAGLNVVF